MKQLRPLGLRHWNNRECVIPLSAAREYRTAISCSPSLAEAHECLGGGDTHKAVLGMIEAGGNIYYLAKFAGIFKLGVQDVGGMQTGMTTEEFSEFLKSQA